MKVFYLDSHFTNRARKCDVFLPYLFGSRKGRAAGTNRSFSFFCFKSCSRWNIFVIHMVGRVFKESAKNEYLVIICSSSSWWEIRKMMRVTFRSPKQFWIFTAKRYVILLNNWRSRIEYKKINKNKSSCGEVQVFEEMSCISFFS